MIVHIANPIYDTVFKYLMEDERIARILLSALLKKNVVKVEQRPHEYVNTSRSDISMFRIDFGATIREEDGGEHLVLIELQKTWLETETLRFRQYLGVQYSRKENIVEESEDKHALPMVAVYLLGHRVGDFTAPVIYVSHKTYDYDGREIVGACPNAFVESLTHDSIIVQIPLLRGRVTNRLEKLLSVFRQTGSSQGDRQTIRVEEDAYAGDAEMEYILKRLVSAAADPEVRQDMNVEDEFFKAIEERDTTILLRDKTIKEQGDTIKEQGNTIKEQGNTIKEQGNTIKEQGNTIKEQGDTIKEQGDTIKEQGKQLEDQERQLAEKDRLLGNAVRGMLSQGMDAATVASLLGLSEEEVCSYRQ